MPYLTEQSKSPKNVGNWMVNPFKHQPHKIVKHTQTIRRQQPANWVCFDHFVELALKGLSYITDAFTLKLTSHVILHCLWSADILNTWLFCSVNIYLSLISFAVDRNVRYYPTLLTSWFTNFNYMEKFYYFEYFDIPGWRNVAQILRMY